MNEARRLLLATALLAPAAARAQAQWLPWRHGSTPPLALRDLDSQPYSLAQMQGQVVLVNFWASWCEPCVDEMPALNQLFERRRADGLHVVGVNFKEGEPRIRAFLQKTAVSFPLLRDSDGSAARDWQVRIFPSTFAIDRGQRLRHVLTGAIDWNSSAALAPIEALLRG